ncbi:glycoside hydrolase family 113 [Ascidiimonas sp. W6]|uniref:glycoside hydrolase family 113 n=1 Tax=Ascidiimonas meishanensis TaxID=3128903 RepID=UPI0030EB39BE
MNKIKYLLILTGLLFFQSSCTQNTKINGLSYVASRDEISVSDIKPLKDAHANWAAVMPFGFMRTTSSPEIMYNSDRQWWGERKEGVEMTTNYLHEKGIKVMIKPQIWVWRGEFTGTIKMRSEEDWKHLEDYYSKFIIDYAKSAQKVKAEVFCIGTELHTFIANRPAYWKGLVTEIRKVYKGKLTYAENWDTFAKVPFWSQLDFIGIDAYFPLSQVKTPTVDELRKGWKKHKKTILEVQEINQKPVIFTEYGYRSVDYTAKEPWNFNNKAEVNLKGQNNALRALYDEFWNEPWFAGGFLWKWFDNHKEAGGVKDSQFTPQNKPAEALVKDFYKNNS